MIHKHIKLPHIASDHWSIKVIVYFDRQRLSRDSGRSLSHYLLPLVLLIGDASDCTWDRLHARQKLYH